MSSLIRKLSFQRVSEILGIELDDVRALVVEERLMPAIYVTQAGYSEPYGLQLLKVDADGRAFDLAVGGINGAVHTGFLRIERDALDRFILDEGFTRAQSPATVKADGSSKNVAHANPIPAPATAQDEMVHPQAAPSPAPVSAEPVHVAPADAGRILKKSVLVRNLQHRWPTIEADLSEASRNGLSKAAHRGRGWCEMSAEKWADENGKLSSTESTSQVLSVWQRTVHRMEG